MQVSWLRQGGSFLNKCYTFAGLGLSWCTDVLMWFELTDILLEAAKQKCPFADDVIRRFLSVKES